MPRSVRPDAPKNSGSLQVPDVVLDPVGSQADPSRESGPGEPGFCPQGLEDPLDGRFQGSRRSLSLIDPDVPS